MYFAELLGKLRDRAARAGPSGIPHVEHLCLLEGNVSTVVSDFWVAQCRAIRGAKARQRRLVGSGAEPNINVSF